MKAKTHNNSGTYDFISGLIEINEFDFSQGSDDLSFFEKILNFNFGGCVSFEDYQAQSEFRKFYLVLLHESMHFIDLNSTLYGLEFLHRRLRVFADIYDGRSFEDSISVFLINYSELSIHDRHVDFNLNCDGAGVMDFVFKHWLDYDEKHGGIIKFAFFDGDVCKSTVPLSMLSMIECHAVAMEFLSKIRFAEMIEGKLEKTIELNSINREINDFLNGYKYGDIEYKLYLCFFFKIFKSRSLDAEIGSKKILRGFSYLLSRVLDLSSMGLASLASTRWFRDHFNKINPLVAENIMLEMKRGLARHVVFFKIIVFFDGLFDKYLDQFKLDEVQCVDEFLKYLLDFEHENGMFDVEFGLYRDQAFEDLSCDNSEINYWRKIREICILNGDVMRRSNYLNFSLADLYSIGFSDCFGNFFGIYNGLDFDGFFKRNQGVFDRFLRGFYGLNLRRDHVGLGGHVDFLDISDARVLDIIQARDDL